MVQTSCLWFDEINNFPEIFQEECRIFALSYWLVQDLHIYVIQSLYCQMTECLSSSIRGVEATICCLSNPALFEVATAAAASADSSSRPSHIDCSDGRGATVDCQQSSQTTFILSFQRSPGCGCCLWPSVSSSPPKSTGQGRSWNSQIAFFLSEKMDFG